MNELANPLKSSKTRVKTERCNVCMRKFHKGYLEKHVCTVNRLLDAVEKARKNSIDKDR
ncbi:hypothetical protein Pjdr2_1536 [Paenibacillus sp. JDR-2]|nr:hypothetical protein Pjdr2_1536 [Paenibacillus sp. JDR-2]